MSEAGTGATQLAIPLLVLSLTGSATTAGLVATIGAIVEGLLRLPGGVIADRWGRRRVMLSAGTLRIVALIVLVAAVLGDFASLPLVLVVVAVISACSVVFGPAETASISRIVPADQLPQAFAQNEARAYGAGLVGPPLGGLFFGLNRVAPFVFDLVTYVASLCAIAAVRTPLNSPDPSPKTGPLTQVREGLSFVWRSSFLRAVILVGSLLNFAAVAALFGTTITLKQAGQPPAVIGIAQGVAAFGGLAGAILAHRMMRGKTVRTLLLGTTTAIAICLAGSVALAGQVWMVIPIAAGLAFAPAANAALMSQLAATTPNEVQGRVISVVILFATAAAGTAPLIVGSLAEHATQYLAMGIGWLAAVASVGVAITSKGLRGTS